MRSDLHMIARHAGTARLAGLLSLTLAVAATEGLGFVLLVPLLENFTQGAGVALPGWLRWSPNLEDILILFVLLVMLRSLAELARGLVAQTVRARVVDGLRHQVLAGLLQARWSALSAMRQGENRALIITTIDRAGFAVDLAADLLRVTLSLTALAFAALLISPAFALAGAAAGLILFALHARFRQRALTLGSQLTERYARIHVRLEEALDALRLIKSVNREERTLAELADSFTSMRRVERDYVRDSGIARAAVQILAALLLALFVWLAVGAGGIALALMLPLVALGLRAVPLLVALQQTAQRWNHERPALAAASDLIALARTKREHTMERSALPPFSRTLVLEKVSFDHGSERPILREVSCTIPAGSLVALTGASGSGKSTLADIIGGLILPDDGRMLIDGAPIAEQSLAAWRRRVSYVHQDAILFSGSIRENLLWAAPDASDGETAEALSRAHAEFVHGLPLGLDTPTGDSGRRLSGGERQRIALARALLRKPDLLILDEPTSALDSGSEAEIARALAELKGSTTILLIAHRGQLIDLADIRLELEEGRLVTGEPPRNSAAIQ